MKITAVRVLHVDRYLYALVETDAGITGLGESGTWGYLEASGAVIDRWREYLVGQDPLRIEHHWQYLYRSMHFRGAAVMGALSAVDVALWDIAGQRFGVPVYQLLGGRCRDRARVYYHVFGETRDELVRGCIAAKERGFTAVGHLSPFYDVPRERPYAPGTHAAKMADAVETVARCREAVGDAVDLCIEIHRRLTPAEAVVFADAIQAYRPMFYEDPVTPDNLDEMVEVARRVNVPIATGERLHSIWEFQALLQRGAVQFARVDVCMAGGITHAKKIAALAEAFHVQVVPHNPLSPVSTAVCVQLAACIPNFAIQELPTGEDTSPKRDIVTQPLTVRDGYLLVPDGPGIGIALAPGAERIPPRPRPFVTRLHEDGSVVDD